MVKIESGSGGGRRERLRVGSNYFFPQLSDVQLDWDNCVTPNRSFVLAGPGWLARTPRTIFKDFASETRGWVTIDAGQDREAVAHEILKHVEPLVQGIDAPIGKLWVHDDA